MTPELTVRSERIDDFVLLINVMMQMRLPEILDRHLPRHWLEQGMTWGWVATIWLAHIVSQGDHRKLTVRDWVSQAQETLEQVTGLSIRETDFTDDRLTIVLRQLSQPQYWQVIEQELNRHTIRVYNLEQKRIRLDATTVSGYHEGGAQSIMQFGNSKDAPDLRQIKVMMASLDPLGLPLATDVISGEKADDGLYLPIINRIVSVLNQSGLLFVGDSKMSALLTRAHIQAMNQTYLMPLALVGQTADQMRIWVAEALQGKYPLARITSNNEQGEETVLAWGYETIRHCQANLLDRVVEWSERVLIVYSPAYAEMLVSGLEQRLTNAIAKLRALTPPRNRGKRQIQDEAQLIEAAETIIRTHRVEGLLSYSFQQEIEEKSKFVGRGRPSANRPQQLIKQIRYQITSVERCETAIDALKHTLGWRAYATNALQQDLTLHEAVLVYRDEWSIERGFHRLKGVPLSLNPLFVKRDDQIIGLTHLLTIAVRLLTLIEFVVRRALAHNQEQLVGLHAENPKKPSATPTSERLLQSFSKITLTIIEFPDRIVRHVTPLTTLQVRILELLGLSPNIYRSLANNSG
jgi:transposase